MAIRIHMTDSNEAKKMTKVVISDDAEEISRARPSP